MTNENYGKCKTCRFCTHSGEIWLCTMKDENRNSDDSCERYRPGCCENCTCLYVAEGITYCNIDDSEKDTIDVCPEYDPCGRRSL